MKKSKSLSGLIKTLESEIRLIKNDIAVLKIKPSNLNEEMILKYIGTRSTAKTAAFFRSKGVKTKRGNVLAGGDISDLIKKGAVDISPKLLNMAQKLLKKNTKMVDRWHN